MELLRGGIFVVATRSRLFFYCTEIIFFRIFQWRFQLSVTLPIASFYFDFLHTEYILIAVIQRVERCSVTVDGKEISSIGYGLLILLGVHKDDTPEDMKLLTRKCAGLRIFSDTDGKMNLSLGDVNGEVLVVSQFTLFGDVRRGLRPYFGDAALPDKGSEYYEQFLNMLASEGLTVKGGIFGAHMHVDIVNDGPVTIILDTRNM